MQEKEKLTQEIEKVGLWTSREEGLEQLVRNTKKVEVLKLQINFRNKVLCQTHPNKDVLKFSHNPKQYSMNQLKTNLLTLVEAMHGDDSGNNPKVTPQAQGVGNLHLQLRQTLTTAQSDTELDRATVEDIVKKSALLVGKKIRHCFEVGNELLWFKIPSQL